MDTKVVKLTKIYSDSAFAILHYDLESKDIRVIIQDETCTVSATLRKNRKSWSIMEGDFPGIFKAINTHGAVKTDKTCEFIANDIGMDRVVLDHHLRNNDPQAYIKALAEDGFRINDDCLHLVDNPPVRLADYAISLFMKSEEVGYHRIDLPKNSDIIAISHKNQYAPSLNRLYVYHKEEDVMAIYRTVGEGQELVKPAAEYEINHHVAAHVKIICREIYKSEQMLKEPNDLV